MIEIRRDGDDELCGYVEERDGRWRALTVFGGLLGEHADRSWAEVDVSTRGLASLAERWRLVDDIEGTDEVVVVQEAQPGRVTVALAPYSIPGVPTRTLTADELDGRTVRLTLDQT